MDLFEDNIFNNDAVYMKSLVGKTIKITTVEEELYTGIVYVIDPIYKTVVLHTKETSMGKHDTVFILHHAIKTLDILPVEVQAKYLERSISVQDHSATILVKKQLLKKWLQKMYIEVNEVGEYLKIDDNLLIMPPYGLDNCVSNNTIVLEKIRGIISLMPENFS